MTVDILFASAAHIDAVGDYATPQMYYPTGTSHTLDNVCLLVVRRSVAYKGCVLQQTPPVDILLVTKSMHVVCVPAGWLPGRIHSWNPSAC